MAKFKKGSPEAKAWGRKMQSLRSTGKPKKSMPRGKSMAKKRNGFGKRKMTVHLIPDVMETVGVLYPALIDNTGNNFTVASQLTMPGTVSEKFYGAVGAMTQQYSTPGELIPAGALVVAGLIVKWIGKKTGLNKIGTKEVKIL